MKSLHFCTPKLLQYIKTHSKFTTIRTGWIPTIYPRDVIALKDRTQDDVIMCEAEVIAVQPVIFKELDLNDPLIKEEIQRYNRAFNKNHYFFKITLNILEVMFI